MGTARRSFLGWLVTAAAAGMAAGAFEVSKLSALTQPRPRSAHAAGYHRIPADMTVLAAAAGKLFHVAGCQFIHGKDKLLTLTVREAEQLGYTPCIRCMKKYLDTRAFLELGSGEGGLAGDNPSPRN
jgi:hypothetical protein